MQRFYIIMFSLIPIGIFSKDYNISYDHKRIKKFLTKNELSELTPLSIPEPIKAQSRLQGRFFTTKKEDNQDYFVYIGRVNTCRAGGCSDPSYATSMTIDTTNLANTEYFDYLILYNSGGIVEKIKIYNYQATHGYEITAKGWLKQFIGVDGKKELEVGRDIDAISGATISVYEITFDVLKKTQLLKGLIKSIPN